MSRNSPSLSRLPPVAVRALAQLGENLAIARARRRESQRQWADRIGVSIPTLIRMERGEASVSVGVYATALWLIGRMDALAELADPAHDRGALERDVRQARRRKVWSRESIQRRVLREEVEREDV
jgi:transcriptional regulator with XRE-family HTH domain